MIHRQVIFSPEAKQDLVDIGDWIAERAGAEIALRYLARLESFCSGLALSSERGHRRDDVRPGLRIVGFERRIAVAFTVTSAEVVNCACTMADEIGILPHERLWHRQRPLDQTAPRSFLPSPVGARLLARCKACSEVCLSC